VASIIEFSKPLFGGAAVHEFLLLQNDAGEFTYIARGGPQSELRNYGDRITVTVNLIGKLVKCTVTVIPSSVLPTKRIIKSFQIG
jgi:hypothetical protein